MTSGYVLRTDRVRLLHFVQRNPSITYGEFVNYWREVHSPLVVSIDVVKRNIRRYEQVRSLRYLQHTAKFGSSS